VLEDVTLGDPRRWPRETALDKEERRSGLERLFEELCERLSEARALHSKVLHVADHQPILIRVMHVMEVKVGIGREQRASVSPAPLERLARLVGVHAGADGNQERLR
jgi:hypothetical protein